MPTSRLQRQHLQDRLVLERPQLVERQRALQVGRVRVFESLRAQKTADLVGAERRAYTAVQGSRTSCRARAPSSCAADALSGSMPLPNAYAWVRDRSIV